MTPYYTSICCNRGMRGWDGETGECGMCFRWVKGQLADEDTVRKEMARQFKVFG